MVSVTDRAGPLFGCTSSRTVPLPVPVAPSVTVTHGTVLAAFHEHAASAVTEIRMSSGPRPASYHRGLIVATQGPSCVNVNGFPATVTMVLRGGPAFAGITRRTVPVPVPVRPLSIVTHDALVLVVHVHELPVVTLTMISSGPLPEL
jgi:hypothetical protein